MLFCKEHAQMNIDKNLLKLTSKTRKPFLLSILSGLLASAFTIILAYFLAKSISEIFLEKKSIANVSNYLIFFFCAAILKAFFIWSEKNQINVVVSSIKKDLRKTIFENLFVSKDDAYSTIKNGEVSNTIVKGVEALDDYFSKYLPQLFLSALTPILILLFVFPLDVLSGVVLMVTAPIIPLLMYLIGSSAEELNKKQWKSLSRMSGYFLDVLQGILTLKMFNRTKEEIKKIDEVSNHFKSTTMKVLRIAFLSALVLELLSTISIAIIAVEIGLRLMYGKMEFGNALFILILAPEFYFPLRQLGVRYHAGLEGVVAFKSIQKLLVKDKSKTPDKTEEFVNGDIEVKDISFIYKSRNSEVLSNVSLKIEKGTTVAIVGESGSGKSTLLKILMKFITPSGGEVLINKININHIEDDKWHNSIGWVSQNPHIFNKSIYDNIMLAKPTATETEIIDAAKNALLHTSILKKENGYQTIVGEYGAMLSGGEIQRLALARIFLRDAPILFLDEPTSSIDSIHEKKIFSRIKKILSKQTIVVVTHRINTIVNADKIIIMDKGKVVGIGKHELLLEQNMLYKKLYNTFKREM